MSRADDAAQRHEGDALLGGLQHGVDGRAGGVAHDQAALAQRGREARREAGLAERHGGGFQLRHAAGADQDVGGEARHRHAEQAQVARPAADQRLGDGDRWQGIVRRHGQQRPIRHQGGERIRGRQHHGWFLRDRCYYAGGASARARSPPGVASAG